MNERMNLYIPTDIKNELSLFAEGLNISRNKAINLILKKFFDENEELLDQYYDIMKNNHLNMSFYERKQKRSNVTDVNSLIAECITNHYEELRTEFVSKPNHIQISQSDEDIFHRALTDLLVISSDKVTDDDILQFIKKYLLSAKWQHSADNKSYRKIMRETPYADFEPKISQYLTEDN